MVGAGNIKMFVIASRELVKSIALREEESAKVVVGGIAAP